MLRFIYIIIISVSLLACNETEWTVQQVQGSSLSVSKDMAADPHIETLIAPYKVQLDTIMNEVLCYSSTPVKHFMPESPLGNFVADLSFELIQQKGFEADMCLLNHFGLRSELPQGAISLRNAYELMPFENELVVMELQAKEMQEMLYYMKNSKGHPIANARMLFSDKEDQISIGGEHWQQHKSYRILTTDYLAKGGDKMDFFKTGKMERSGIKLRDAIIIKMQQEDSIRTATDGRLVFLHKKETTLQAH